MYNFDGFKKFILNFAFFIIFPINLLGTESELVEESDKTEIGQQSQLEKDLIETNRAFSNWFNSVTEGLDLLLVGKKITNTQNPSRIIVDNYIFSREGKNFVNLTTISVNPRFPNLEAYWNLKFTTYDDTSVSTRSEGGYATQTPRDQKYAATIGIFRKLDNVRIAFQPRIELQDPLRVSHAISAETVFMYKMLLVNPKLQFFAKATEGTGSFQAFNLNYKLTDIYSLTFINEGEYEDKLHRYSVNNGISLGQLISDTAAFSYGFSLYSNNRPNYHLEAYSFSVTWSQVIYRDILDYQIKPHFDFVKSEDFRGFIGLVLGLSLKF